MWTNYRTIALVYHASKVLLTGSELPAEQAGLSKKELETRLSIKRENGKSNEYENVLYMCFTVYKKAFDCVNHNYLWNTL